MGHRLRPPLYWEWIESEAALIGTDGCSKVSGAYRRCCLQHDLSYYYAADPSMAYRIYRSGDTVTYWQAATPLTRATADAQLRRCIQSQSRLGFFSPVAAWRWLGVTLGARRAWNGHREREKEGLRT